jgi:hypothetical protein
MLEEVHPPPLVVKDEANPVQMAKRGNPIRIIVVDEGRHGKFQDNPLRIQDDHLRIWKIHLRILCEDDP